MAEGSGAGRGPPAPPPGARQDGRKGQAKSTPSQGSKGEGSKGQGSARLEGMKFMQRARKRKEAAKALKRARKAEHTERWGTAASSGGRCRVVREGELPAGAVAVGRMSFGNFNAATEAEAAEALRRQEAEAEDRAEEVTDEEMARAYKKQKKRKAQKHSRPKGGADG